MGHLSTARVDWGILSKHQAILKVLQIECHSGWGATVPPILRFIDSLTRWLRLGLRLVWSIWRSLPETQILEMQVDRLYPLDVSKSMNPKKLTISKFWNQKVTWEFDCSFILRTHPYQYLEMSHQFYLLEGSNLDVAPVMFLWSSSGRMTSNCWLGIVAAWDDRHTEELPVKVEDRTGRRCIQTAEKFGVFKCADCNMHNTHFFFELPMVDTLQLLEHFDM